MNDIEIRKQLDKIINSHAFSLSGVYKRLLEYLTEATLKGERPKEFTIGHAVFHQEVDDPATSRVRVSVYKLRKRLEKYYKEEGLNDPIVFSIPKGGYVLEFTPKKEIEHKIRPVSPKNQNRILWIILLVFALSAFVFWIVSLQQETNYHQLKRTAFWNELTHNKKETIVVAGDFFAYRDLKYEREHDRFLNVRDIQINTEEQLQAYIASDSSLKQEDYAILHDVTYMPRDALFSMQQLFPLLYENKVNYQIILSSDFNWETYKDYNIIYIGTYKNLKALSILTDKLKIKYDHNNHFLTVKKGEETNTYLSTFFSNKNIDYTLVAKVPGSSKNVIYMFVSDNDIGCIEATKYFTQLDSLRQFERNMLKDANFFKSIYKAEGIQRTSVTFELIEYEPITDTTLRNFWHY